MHAWAFDAIGTAWQIDTPDPVPADVRAAVLARIDAFDAVWSRFRSDSVVSQMATRPGTWQLADGDELLDLYDQLHDVTDGAVNPLVGRSLSDLGYDAGYSLTATGSVEPVQDWSSLERHGSTVTTAEPLLLDVGAAGKGLLVDLVAGLLGPHPFTVDASGDLYHGGTVPIRVALEHPADPTRAIGVVSVEPGEALCASATNRRAWGDGLHHVIDARTARPTDDVIATWVLASQSCMLADGLATAHFFADDRTTADLVERFPHHYVRMHADGRVQWSPDLPGEIFR